MFTINTELYDHLELEFNGLTESKRFFTIRKKSERTKRIIALSIVNESLFGVLKSFIENSNEASDSGDLPEDARALRQRMFDSFANLDNEKMASLDEKYITKTIKDGIDSMLSLSEIELATIRYRQSSEMWTTLVSSLRQLQTFFEAKVTFENYPI